MLENKRAILVFLKAPIKGLVKTRLAKTVGPEAATSVYRALVARQMEALQNLSGDWVIEVHFAPAHEEKTIRKWLGQVPLLQPQSEGDLGNRLESAVSSAFERGAHQVYCIGGDCPELVAKHFERAAHDLDTGSDLAIGPSEDGGYYLIAMRAPRPELFQQIPWSTDQTYEATTTQADRLGLKVSKLETLYDIDTEVELSRAISAGFIAEDAMG